MFGIGYGVNRAVSLAASWMELTPDTSKPVPPGTERASVRELSEQMARPGGLTSEDLVIFLQERIRKRDPALNAIIELNPQALEIARELDRERASGTVRGPLHGIPVLLKDNIETGDTQQTSAGAFGLVGAAAIKDAFIVERLRQQGAVILGKTNLTELAGFRGGPDGFSHRGGQTLNPHQADAQVGGSSSGSAVAVAAGLAPLAVGTETNGSIVVPDTPGWGCDPIEEKMKNAPDKGYEIGVVIGTYLPFLVLIIIAYTTFFYLKKKEKNKPEN